MGSEGSLHGVLIHKSPAEIWERDVAKSALDKLFTLNCQYWISDSYHSLLKFV